MYSHADYWYVYTEDNCCDIIDIIDICPAPCGDTAQRSAYSMHTGTT